MTTSSSDNQIQAIVPLGDMRGEQAQTRRNPTCSFTTSSLLVNIHIPFRDNALSFPLHTPSGPACASLSGVHSHFVSDIVVSEQTLHAELLLVSIPDFLSLMRPRACPL